MIEEKANERDDLGRLANRYCEIINDARMSERNSIMRKSRPSDVFKYDEWINESVSKNKLNSDPTTGWRNSISILPEEGEETDNTRPMNDRSN